MDYYQNAEETEQAATALHEAGLYRQSVYMSCLAVELFLKSKLHLVQYEDGLDCSHDVINIYKAIQTRFSSRKDLGKVMIVCRKYLNESRYPYGSDTSAYTKEFALEFLGYVTDVKDFIDNVCIATMDDLQNKYSNLR